VWLLQWHHIKLRERFILYSCWIILFCQLGVSSSYLEQKPAKMGLASTASGDLNEKKRTLCIDSLCGLLVLPLCFDSLCWLSASTLLLEYWLWFSEVWMDFLLILRFVALY